MSSDEQRDIRFAAETIYRNAAQRPPLHLSKQRTLWQTPFFIYGNKSTIKSNLNYLDSFHFSTVTTHTVRSIEFYQWRLYCRIQRRWCDVDSSPFLLFIRCIRSVFHFDALVHLHYGKYNWLRPPLSVIHNVPIFSPLQMNGDTILNALKVQVVHYTIQSSLFDIIFAAFIRFSLLIIFYGVFAINHWSIIAVSDRHACRSIPYRCSFQLVYLTSFLCSLCIAVL